MKTSTAGIHSNKIHALEMGFHILIIEDQVEFAQVVIPKSLSAVTGFFLEKNPISVIPAAFSSLKSHSYEITHTWWAIDHQRVWQGHVD